MSRYDKEIIGLSVQLLHHVISVTSYQNGNKEACNYKPLARWFFQMFEVKEDDFILALAYLRDYYPEYYDRINVPSQWDGCAHLDFPHLFLNNDVILLMALQPVPKMLTEEGMIGPYKTSEKFKVPKKIAAMLIKRRLAREIKDGN